MTARYFAYGSNLKVERMSARVPGARVLGPAQLRGRRVVCNKRGADGSAKANLVLAPGEVVWGVVYEFALEHWDGLDGHEGGYLREAVTLWLPDGGSLHAETYVSSRLTPDPRPLSWYKQLIVEGAREHGLPVDYVARLEALEEVEP